MKRRILYSVLAILAFPLMLIAGIEDWVSVVRITDNYRETTFAVMTNQEYTDKTKEIWDRNRMLTQAIRLARDKWSKADDTKDKVFPVSITCKAEIKRLKTFPDAEKANPYMALMEEEWAARVENKKPQSYAEKRVEILRDELENQPKYFPGGKATWVKVRKDELALMLVEVAEQRAKEREIEAIESQAKGFIEEHITAALSADTKQTGPTILAY